MIWLGVPRVETGCWDVPAADTSLCYHAFRPCYHLMVMTTLSFVTVMVIMILGILVPSG